jgi:hypothetical protein
MKLELHGSDPMKQFDPRQTTLLVLLCLATVACAWLAGCGDDPASPPAGDGPIVTEIGPAGGTAVDAHGDVELAIPAGAVASTVGISIGTAAAPPQDTGMILARAYDFGPDGTLFAQPVTMRIAYEESQIPAGVQVDELRLCKVVGGGWEIVAGSTVDPANDWVEGTVTSFSTYGVGHPDVGEDPSITIQPPTITVPLYGTVNFLATVDGLENEAIVWSIREGEIGGRVRSGGLYNAWYSSGVFHVVATSVENPEIFGEAEITVSSEWECPEIPPEEPYELVWSRTAPVWIRPNLNSINQVGAVAWTPQGLRIGAEYQVQYWSLTGQFEGWSGRGFYDVIGDQIAGHETYIGYHAGMNLLDVPISGTEIGAYFDDSLPRSDGLGSVYVYNSGRVTVLDSEGAVAANWEGISAEGMTIGPDNRIYVVGRGPGPDYGIHRYTLQGQWFDSLLQIEGEDYLENASSSRHLAGFDREGRLCFPFRYGQWAIGLISPDLEYLGSIVRQGSDACEAYVSAAVVDPDGNVLLAGADSEWYFKKFDRNGWLLARWSTEGIRVRGMALDPEGNLYVTGQNIDDDGYTVRKYSPPSR